MTARHVLVLVVLLTLAGLPAGAAGPGNRLAYLDGPCDPYYVGRDTARLTTPQWIGEEGVEAAIVLAIDDMTDTARYEAFLRPVLDRLKAIDGRAPVSIMTKHADPADPQIRAWLDEGLSIECHTVDHPCPLLGGGDIRKAKDTYDRCVDLLHSIPDYRPVAFRMPCCDSMNSVSPRFFTEIFGKTTPNGNFLTMDSSVFVLFTADDPELPRTLVLDPDGGERFRKYIPTDRIFANWVEDYPYPWVIDHKCWEIPSVMPSDWEAQHLHGKCSPKTVEDFQAAIDAVVLKQGVFSICFHPHGWISAEQMAGLVDYAATKHGGKIKFLTFRDVQQRLDANFLEGRTIRGADGRGAGVRVRDVDQDGRMDVTDAGSADRPPLPKYPPELASMDELALAAGLRLVDLDEDGHLDAVFSNPERYSIHLFVSEGQGSWRELLSGKRGDRPTEAELPPFVRADGTNNGVWFKHGHLWVQNEDTGGKLPGHVDSRSFATLLGGDKER